MPLLGRHKSSSPSSPSPSPPPATDANNRQATMAASQQLCESPLFGIRRQLPSSDGGRANCSGDSVGRQQQTGSNKQQGVSNTGLSSIPQQITRQQIHYAFSIMDSNKDGQVDVRDLSQMLANLGIPIDEAILSYIMKNTVSKRGDHRVSEAEFLDWISHFIQVRADSPPVARQRRATGPTGRPAARVTRSPTAGTSLVAQASEGPRPRRGSGSGIALTRSLSSSSASSSAASKKQGTECSQSCDRNSKPSSAGGSKLQHQSSADSIEARNDLKAAFCVFDLDGDGYITLDEVRAGLKLLGESWTQVELRKVFSECNSNRSSPTSDLTKQRISIDDFVRLLL